MLFYTKELQELVSYLEELGYEVPKELIVDPKSLDNDMRDLVVICSGQGKSLFKMISNIANNEVDEIDFDSDDVIVIASPVVPGV